MASASTASDARPPATIPQLLAQQARTAPQRTALEHLDQILTYGELNARANQLAHHLQQQGVGPDTFVAICLERSIDLVVAIHGVLKAGGAYVPLDPADPPQRRRFILDDCRPRVLVTKAALAPAVTGFDGAIALLDAHADELARCPSGNPEAASGPADLAYAIYTSGSTGPPKGVQVEHRSVMNCAAALQALSPLGAGDAYLFKMNHAFDASLVELLGPLFQGGRLVILPAGEERDPGKLLAAVQRHEVTHLVFVPSMLQAVLAGLSPRDLAPLRGLKSLEVGGETVNRALMERMRAACPEARLLNLYGPTEATIAVTAFDLRGEFAGVSAPIGQPLPQVTVRILDPHLRPVPAGSEGELCIGGVAVARGYLHRPELNAIHFVDDPEAPGERLYRSGDLGRLLPSGAIEFVGRRDGQVKIRGHRVELGEIESRLAALPQIADAAVVAQSEASGEKRLAAYYVPSPGSAEVDPVHLQALLRQSLPAYMVPSAWRRMTELPVTANGKRDLRALTGADPGAAAPPDPLGPPPEPSSALRRAIVAAWTQELGIEGVDEDQDFFALGGHSLTAVRVAARLREALDKDVSANDLYRAPTIALLERLVGNAADLGEGAQPPQPPSKMFGADPSAAAPRVPLRPFPLAYQQLDCWLLEKIHAPNLNVLSRKRVAGRLDGAALAAALDRVLAEHPALRYRISPRLPRQSEGTAAGADILERDLSGLAPEEKEEAALASLAELSRHSDWSPGQPLVQLRLLRFAPEVTELQACMPHIVSDEASMEIFFSDLSRHYQSPGAALRSEQASYEDFVHAQRAALSPTLAPDRAFWEEYLEGTAAIRFPESEVVALEGSESVYLEWPSPEVEALASLARSRQVSLPDLLHALALSAVAPYVESLPNGRKPVAFYNPRSTRTSAAYDRTIGALARLDCLKAEVGDAPDLIALARRLRQAKQETESHQACPAAVKRASLNKHRWEKMAVRDRLARLAARGATWLLPQARLDYEVALALARMQNLRRAPSPEFTLLVNVLHSFVAPEKETERFGCALAAVARLPTFQPPVERVLEIYFLREPHRRNQPLIMLNGDLSAALRRQLGASLLQAARLIDGRGPLRGSAARPA